MTQLIYEITVRGLLPAYLPRKVIEAHIAAVKSAQKRRKRQSATPA